MGLGMKKVKDMEFERFNDVLADAQRAVHKSQKIFYVDSNTGASTNNGLRLRSPFATLAQAYSACTASQGDRIFVLPNHAETATAVLTMSKADVAIQGFSLGNKRPVITINGAVDLFSMTAAGQEINNLDLTIATTDAATALVNVAAAKCAVRNVKMIPSATSVNVVDCITLASGGDDFVLEDCEGYNTTVAINSWVSIEAAVARFKFLNCWFEGDVATAGVIDGAAATQMRWENLVIKTVGTNIPGCILDSNPTGTAKSCHMLGTDATIANNAQWGNAMILTDIYTRGGTGSTVQATNIIPALDT